MPRVPVTRRWAIVAALALAAVAITVGAAWWTRPSPAPAGLVSPPPVAASFDATSPDGPWTVSADGASFVGYRAREMLSIDVAEVGAPNEAVGRTTATTGTLQVAGTRLMAATITADLSQLHSDLEMRDGHLAEAFNFPAHRTATFTLAKPVELGAPALGQIVDVAALGDLTINDVTKRVTFPLQARWNGPSIQVAGGIAVERSAFNLDTGQFFLFRVAEQFTIEVQLTFVRACGTAPCLPGEHPPLVAGGPSPSPGVGPLVTGAPAGGDGSLVFVGMQTGSEFGQVLSRHLYRVRADGTNVLQLTNSSGEFDPTVAPDGRIAFGHATDTGIELWILKPDGQQVLVEAPGDITRYDFSPDGKTLVGILTAGRVDVKLTTELVTVDPATAAVTPLTTDGQRKDSPDWAPDGKRIAFGMLTEGSNGDDIYVLGGGAADPQRITEDPGYEYTPDWSPDGKRLIFARPDGLVIRDMTTGSETVLPTGPANVPAWSPDGKRIAFESGGAIWIANADGSGARRLDLPFDVASYPVWLPGS